MQKTTLMLAAFLPLVIFASGCAGNKKLVEENEFLKGQLSQLEQNQALKDQKINSLQSSHRDLIQKASDLEMSRDALARSLAKEISEYQAKLELSERGLVITFLQDILFDSGRAEVKPQAFQALSHVAEVINDQAKGHQVVVEGHTDNVPIKYSGWKSNWELSAHRALSVLDYFVANAGVSPDHLAVMGYGEHKPVAANASDTGRRQNRRVEIVIFPEKISRVSASV